MPRRPLVAGAVLCALSMMPACAPVGPNYSRPQMSPPTAFRFGEQFAANESLADTPWWNLFADPTLQSLVREAIANNLDLRAALARVEGARAQAGIARSFLYPQVDGTAAYTVQQNIEKHDDDVRQNATYGFQLSWELDLFGRIRRQREAALARLLATDHARRGVLVTLIGDVTSTYFLLRQLDEQLDIARRTLSTNDQTVSYFQTRVDGGVSNRLELDRMRANRAATAAAIPDLETQIAVTEDALSLLVGRPPGPIARNSVAGEAPPAIPPGLPTALLERRPDVVEAEQLLVAANADVGAARALFYPALSLTGFAGGISGDLAGLLGPAGGIWSLTPSLLQPIFNAGRLRHGVEAARAAADGALAQYQKAALNAYREVADALVTISKLAEQRVSHEAGVAALEDAAGLARDRYDSGLTSYIDILTADQQLFQEELLLAQTRGAEFRARSELYRALGGGWQP